MAVVHHASLSPLRSTQDLLVTVFENGSLLQDYTLEEIRKKAQLSEEEESPPAQHNRDQKSTAGGIRIINGLH